MFDKEVLRKNLIYLNSHSPSIVEKLLKSLPSIEKKLQIIQKHNDVDIVFGGNVYENLQAISEEKLKNMYEDMGIVWTSHVNMPEAKSYYEEHLFYSVSRDDILKQTETITIYGAFPFFHIKKMLERKEEFFPHLKEVLIYEPNMEFIYLLLSTIDITTVATEKKINIYILFEQDRALDYIGRTFIVFTFNTYYFSYTTEEISILQKRIEKMFKANLVTIDMTTVREILNHTKINIKNQNNRYLTDDSLLKINSDFPVVLVASGPSLEQHLEYLKHIQDKAIIIAVGTAIRPLIIGGVTPDFNVAIDAQEKLDRFIEGIDTDILKEIYLMSALFVTPAYITPFKNSSSLVIKYRPINNFLNIRDKIKYTNYFGSPTVSNTAFEIFVTLGFRKILLFGMDFGTKYKDQQKLHAKGYLKEGESEEEIFKSKRFIEVEGSLGGVVYAPTDFNASRIVLEEEIQFYRKYVKGLKVYNFSDGAKIEGTIPSQIDRLYSLIKNRNKKMKKQIKRKIVQSFKKVPVEFDRASIKKLQKLYPVFSTIKEKAIAAVEREDYTAFCKEIENLQSLFSMNEMELEFVFNHYDFNAIKTIYRYVKPVSEKLKHHKKQLISISKKLLIECLDNIDKIYIDIISNY